MVATRTDQQGVTPATLEDLVSPMALLASGIPLSLLLDLACGPQSADLLDHEHATACHAKEDAATA